MKKLYFIILFFLIFYSSCSFNEKGVVQLQGKWTIASGNWNEKPSDVKNRVFEKIDKIHNLEKKLPTGKGTFWIKFSFNKPSPIIDENYAVFLNVINPVDVTYLNGMKIGSSGIAPFNGKNYINGWNKLRLYSFHSKIITEKNEILIKLYVHHESSMEKYILMGPKDSLLPGTQLRKFFRRDLNIIFCFLMLYVAFYHLMIYIKRKKDVFHLWYSITCFLFAFSQINFFILDLPVFAERWLSYVVFQKIVFVSMCLIPIFYIQFINSFLKIKEKTIFLNIFRFILIAESVILIFAHEDSFLQFRLIMALITTVPIAMYIFILPVKEMFKRNRYGKLIFLGQLPFFLCILADYIFHFLYPIDSFVYLSSYGIPTLILTMGFILGNEYIEDRNNLEELNIILDDKVEERTVLLKAARDEIADAKEEVDAMNESLMIINDELTVAQSSMSRDLIMAKNVQNKFFLEEAPVSDLWDAAYINRPMTEVTGDLYDFYLKDGVLNGVSVFDVSGHGVASALVGMIVKTIAFRKFTEDIGQPLGQLMENINEELIKEIGLVDNYATGIIVRFTERGFEFVNAAHTDIIILHENNTVDHVGDYEKRGYFIGQPLLVDKYNTESYECAKGDIILLYTDCLIETRNLLGEEFGVEGLIDSLKNNSSKDVTQLVKKIETDIVEFAQTDFLKDDLTIVAIRRK